MKALLEKVCPMALTAAPSRFCPTRREKTNPIKKQTSVAAA
jgi:hypothetical protein